MELWNRQDRSGGGDFVGAGDAKFGFYVPRKYWASRLAPYAGEWAAAAIVWPISWLIHLWVGDAASVAWAAVGETLLGAGLTALTWQVGRARGAMTRRMATATVAVGAVWFLCATIIGPTNPPLVQAWVFGGATVALAWNIKRALRSGEDEDGGGLLEQVGLAKVRAGQAEIGPNKVTVPLGLLAGKTSVEEVQKASDSLAQGLRLHKGSVRVTGDPDDLSKATMTIVPIDVLRHPQSWPGPSQPGGSIADPLVVGLYEDGSPVHLWLPGDPSTSRNATHLQVNGMNGSGKSGGAQQTWTEILTRRDVALVILDPSKGEQSAGYLPEDSAHLVIGKKECREFMRKVPAVVTAQADQLGKWGYDQWVPEVYDKYGMPYLVLWVEEASDVLQDADTITTIAETARSAGICLVLSQQKSSFRRMNTDIRSQLGGGWCFGVNELTDATYCLSDEVVDAGARPDRWKNRRPGCFHLEAAGVDEQHLAMPARTFKPNKSAMSAAIEQLRDLRARMFPATAAALGLPARPVRTTTMRPGQPARSGEPAMNITTLPDPANPNSSMSLADLGVTAADLADLGDLDAAPDWPEHLDDTGFTPPADPEPDLDGDVDTELPTDDDVADTRLPQGRPTRAQARAKLHTLLARMVATGTTELTIRDLPEPAALFGRGRSWLSVELSRLAETGHLEAIGQDGNAIRYRVNTIPEHHAA